MKALHLFPLPIIFLILAPGLIAQVEPDTSQVYIVEMMDNNLFVGRKVYEDSTKIELMTDQLGKLTLDKSFIKSIQKLSPKNIVNGKLWLENPQSSRYFWAPNGYGLKAGEGYYQNIWVFWNQASVGFTKNFSLGIGLIPTFLFGADAAEATPVWLVPKFSIPVKEDQFNLGLGALLGNIGFEPDAGFGIVYGLGTFGNRNDNFTFGLGYGYAGGTWAKRPMITASFMHRTGPKGYILSENYYFPAGDSFLVLFSFGGRSFARRVGIDYGLFIPFNPDMNSMIAIPWLGFTVPFEKKKK